MTGCRLNSVGDCKTGIVVHDRPCGFRSPVDTVGAETIARLPWAFYKLLGPADVVVNGIDPGAFDVFGANAETALAGMLGQMRVVRYEKDIGIGLAGTQIGHTPERKDIACKEIVVFGCPPGIDGLGQL